MKFTEFLILKEAPITDYKTFGDFSKGSSFRDKRDRFLITNPRTIEHVKKKFGNTDYNINMYFMNSPQANKWTEEGSVNLDWVRKNLGDEIADHISPKLDDDAINIIFTNNKGAERINMTAWMIAHRLFHALGRSDGRGAQFYQYNEAGKHYVDQINNLLQCYSNGNTQISTRRGPAAHDYGPKSRDHQLLLKNISQQICTFKSARDGVIRDWFEVLHELGAQLVTTGNIKFNDPPKSLKVGRYSLVLKDEEEAKSILDMLGRDMGYYINALLGSVVNSILVM